jgi:hypothetical protein
MESAVCYILVLVSYRWQLYDFIDITNGATGLGAEKKRVLGLVLVYQLLRWRI